MITVYHIAAQVRAEARSAGLPSPPRKKSKKEVRTTETSNELSREAVWGGVQKFAASLSNPPRGFDVLVAADGQSASFCFVPGALEALRTDPQLAATHFCDADIAAAKVLPRIIHLDIDGRVQTAFGEIFRANVSKQVTADGASGLSRRVLVVGAGGIGCELLKVATLQGFRDMVVVDLDTIDATNLNRQFLFRKEDVGQSKAVTARKAMLSIFENGSNAPAIEAHHANIKDPLFSVDYFKQFAIVMNGLDNTSARKHVNRLCMQAGIPLIESGTMGYNGQVQPICKSLFECYDCQPKSSEQKTFAVCTIHAHPSTMVHCTHFAKEFYGRLFGDAAGADEMAFVETIPPSSLVTRDGAVALFKLLFQEKIEQLTAMRQQWQHQPPQPICLPGSALLQEDANDFKSDLRVEQHQVLSVESLARAFVAAVTRCARRERVAFRKDDPLSTALVAVVANLRATCFHIPNQAISEVVTIAGSIVPAIATTNAIIAASVVAQAAVVLKGAQSSASFVYVRKAPQVRRRLLEDGLYVRDKLILHSNTPSKPNLNCVVCSNANPSLDVRLNADLHTVGSFVRLLLKGQLAMAQPFVNCGSSVLWEEEETETLRDAPLRRWLGSGSSEFVVGCMTQSTEWSATVTHDPNFLDVAHFSVNGYASGSAEEMEALRAAAIGRGTLEAAEAAAEEVGAEVVAFHPSKAHIGKSSKPVASEGTHSIEEELVVVD